MSRKHKIVRISSAILRQLLYGQIYGPVNSDAPPGMKVIGNCGVTKLHSTEQTGDVDILVEHDNFDEVPRGAYPPILEIVFSNDLDLDVQDMIKGLQQIATNQFKSGDAEVALLHTIANKLEFNGAKYNQLLHDYCERDDENRELRHKLNAVISVVKNHQVSDI